MLGGTLVLILLVLLAMLFLVMGVRVVKQGYVYTIERLGKYRDRVPLCWRVRGRPGRGGGGPSETVDVAGE